MWSKITNVIASVVFLALAACHAQAGRRVDHVSALVSQTGYIQFTPDVSVLPDLAFPSQVIGSAWVVKDGWHYKIVTAQHVALGTMTLPGVLEVCSSEHNCIALDRFNAVGPIVGESLRHDWAYWQVDALPVGLRPSRIASNTVVGDSVCVVGAPLGRIGEVTCGAITNDIDGFIYIDARVLPGNSGGPVFDSRGCVLGMVVAMDDPENHSMSPVSNSVLVLGTDKLWF